MRTNESEPSHVEQEAKAPSRDFIREMVQRDLQSGKYGGRVVTRFPPEPNGYLHIGHAKSIVLNFGLAEEFGGRCHLRFDDTNPTTEDMEFVESIKRDVHWLGFDWGEHLYFTSDYFEKLYDYAVQLIRAGKAYVDSSSEEEIRASRGTISEPGKPTPYRDRSVEENLDLFRRMRDGEFEDGTHVLRAKIDLAAKNMKMRDPLLYRIRKGAKHYRTGTKWNIYPFYDFAHCLSDAIEGITYSLCTLEFENNRELYDWVLDAVGIPKPRTEQTEFARLNLSYTVMSKRKLAQLVREGHVSGWDDPRMPTLSGLRRRGYTPTAIRNFCNDIGVARTHNVVDVAKLEHAIREDLNMEVKRVLCVLRPLEVIIENFPEDQVEWLDAPYYPRDVPKEGSRKIPFTRRIFIERTDFAESPPKGWHRLSPGAEVRLRYAYFLRCERVVKDEQGRVVQLRCTYDPETKGGYAPDGRSPKGTLHWVSAEKNTTVEVRLYDRLFDHESPDGGGEDFLTHLNPSSLEVISDARLEVSVDSFATGDRYQFERQGFFVVDPDSEPGHPVFNRTVTLRDTWAKKSQAAAKGADAKNKSKEKSRRAPKENKKGAGQSKRRSSLNEEQKAVASKWMDLGVEEELARAIAQHGELDSWLQSALDTGVPVGHLARWAVVDLMRETKGVALTDVPFDARGLAELVKFVDKGTISREAGKFVLAQMVESGKAPADIIQEAQLTASEQFDYEAAAREVIEQFPDEVQRYRSGKQGLLGFFVGQVMRRSRGKADAGKVREALEKLLAG